ncbi:hypothetical protein QUF80_23430, partial [Desulfococcaceae bacterium HSG8]|nr:hypothetical protein [Desulfococcaceae bacterium HSG8]
FLAGHKLPVIDTAADDYFKESITKATVVYTTCRIVNGIVSVVKDFTIHLQLGAGMTLPVGQAFDPVDDMVERLSDVLVTAITSLGVQKLLYEIAVSFVPPILAVFILLLSILIWQKDERLESFQIVLIKFSIILAIARFTLPISSIANGFVKENLFDKQITEAREKLASPFIEFDKKLGNISFLEADEFSKTNNNNDSSFFRQKTDSLKNALKSIKDKTSFFKEKSTEFKNALVVITENKQNIIRDLLELTSLYVGIILFQVILLPLLSFWLLIKAANSLFQPSPNQY